MFSQQFYSPDLSFLSQSAPLSYCLIPKTTISQKQIIIDIIYLLLGLKCSILSKKNNSDQYQLSSKYQLSHLSADALQNAVKEAVKLGNQNRYIQIQARRLYLGNAKNPVVRTFCEALFQHSQTIKTHFSSILASLTMPLHSNSQSPYLAIPNNLTLLTLPSILQKYSHIPQLLIRCINSCQLHHQRKSQTVRLLDKMWEIQQQMLSCSQKQKEQIAEIFKRVIKMYMQGVKDWIKMRSIPQGCQFFVQLQQNSKSNYLQSFLHENKEIQPTKLPKLMESESKAILELGKTIRFISLYYQSHMQERLMRYLDVDGEFKILDQALTCQQKVIFRRVAPERISLNERIRRKNAQSTQTSLSKIQKMKSSEEGEIETKQKDNPYAMFDKQSNAFKINWIQKRSKIQHAPVKVKSNKQICQFGLLPYIRCLLLQILQNINRKCLNFFRDPKDVLEPTQPNRIQASLTQTLTGIKKFMLLEQGDFAEQFFSAASQIIDKQKGQISHTKIYSCIDEAIENSSAKNLNKSILNNIHFDFIKFQQQEKRSSDRQKLWMLFCFNYRQVSPINYILNATIMQKLKDINNMIIKLKRGQSVLSKIWNENRQNQNLLSHNSLIHKKQRVLCNSLLTFISTALSFTLQSLHSTFKQYCISLTQTPTLFTIVSQTNQLIINLLKYSVGNKLLFNSTMQALLLVQKYRKLHNMIQDQEIIVPPTHVQQLEFQLRGAVEILRDMPELREVVDYNGFYQRVK